MERERWRELSQAISEVDARWPRCRRHTHPTARIARVYCWAVAHDRSISWACQAENWPPASRPELLPDQSTLSRRTRGKDFDHFLRAVGKRLDGKVTATTLLKRIDGKPLPVAAHSGDRDATWGKGAGKIDRGYKLHALWSDRPMPLQWAITPLHVPETRIARRMIRRLSGAGVGYLLADSLYDSNELHDLTHQANHQLVAPRQKPGRGLGHCAHSPRRLRCIDMLEPPCDHNPFGPTLHNLRRQIERDFGNLTSYGGGLTHLPPWVRRIWRVRLWVQVKLLLNAARIRCRRRRVAA